jgi:nicotinamidase/pyrazinamidase
MKKILIVVDYQHDFVNPNGVLPVPNADNLYQTIQKRIDNKKYSHIVYTFDTHTEMEYKNSEESKLFPDIHCNYKSKGWELFNIKPRAYRAYLSATSEIDEPFTQLTINDESFFTKNQFDIWVGNPKYAEWFERTFDKDTVEIDICGVALNYCVFSNVMGLIERGYKVNIIENAVEGIKSFPDGTVDTSYEQNKNIMKNRNVNFI